MRALAEVFVQRVTWHTQSKRDSEGLSSTLFPLRR